jgi:hypothetical protein
MKAVILKDRHMVHAVFVRNDVSEQEITQLQTLAETYMQEIVIKEVSVVRTMSDMVDEINALNEDGECDNKAPLPDFEVCVKDPTLLAEILERVRVC